MVIPPAIAMAFQLGPNPFVTSYTGHTFHHPFTTSVWPPVEKRPGGSETNSYCVVARLVGPEPHYVMVLSVILFQAHVLRWLYDFYHRPSDERLEVPHITQDALGGIVNKVIPIILKMTASMREIDCG